MVFIVILNDAYREKIEIFLNLKLKYSKYFKLIDKNDITENMIILTDDINFYDSLKNKEKYLLIDNLLNVSNNKMIYKYQSFENILENIMSSLNFKDELNLSKLKLITVSSILGGEGKTTFINGLCNYLSKKNKVAILSFFSDDVAEEDFSNFILNINNSNEYSDKYIYKNKFGGYSFYSIKNIIDYYNINDSIFKNIIKYLETYNFNYLIVENIFPFNNLNYEFIRNSDYKFLIIDKTKEDMSNFREKYFPQLNKGKIYLINNKCIDNSIMNIPICNVIYNNYGIINEKSVFYNSIKQISDGVINEL